MAQRLAATNDRDRERKPSAGARTTDGEEPEQPGEHHGEEGQREHAAERRIALRRPADARVAERQPGKAGERPRAQPFRERPRRGNKEAGADRIARRNARLQPAGGCRIEGEKRAEDERRESRERRRQAADLVHAHINPRYAGEEQAEPERETRPEALFRRCIAPRVHEPCEREERERIETEGRERAHGEGAGDKWGQPPFILHDFGLSTSSV